MIYTKISQRGALPVHWWKKTGVAILGCFLLSIFPLTAQQILKQNIQLKHSEYTFLEVLQDLQQTQGVRFSYDERVLPSEKIKFNKKQWQLQDLLKKLETHSKLEFHYLNGQIIIKKRKDAKVKLSGTIKAAGKQLPGATIYVNELKTGSVADANGHYSLLLPPGKYTSIFSFIGHQRKNRLLDLENDTSLDIHLNPEINKLNEVTINGQKKIRVDFLNSPQTSAHKVDVQQLSRLPMLVGETDLLKGMQTLPGVQNATPGTVNFSVRGGTYDQNMVLLDGIPIYNTTHSLGFFSSINPDVIDQITLYKGDIPARYGGRISSITDMQTSNDLVEKFNLSGGINFLNSRLSINTPIGKKASIRISGRISTSAIINLFHKSNDNINAPPVNRIHNATTDYTDLIGSVLLKPTQRDQVKLSTMLSQDDFQGVDLFNNRKFNWKSTGLAINWQRKFNSSLTGNFNLHYHNLIQGYLLENVLGFGLNGNSIQRTFGVNGVTYQWQAGIEQIGAKMDFSYSTSAKSKLNFGTYFTKHRFNPGKTFNSRGIDNITLADRHSLETGMYLMHQLKLSPSLEINYGARLSGFYNIGGNKYIYDEAQNLTTIQNFNPGELMDSFFGFEPRLNIHYQFNSNVSLKASYNRNYQYLHQLNNSAVQLPTNLWLPSSNNVKPRFTDQFSLGYFQQLDKKGSLHFSAEAYVRLMHRVNDYRDNTNLLLNDDLATEIRTGVGQAYGLELMLRKKGKKLNGAVSYTLSRTVFNIPGINQGKSYVPRYDRLHNLSLNISYKLSRRWHVASTFTYMSGASITMPQGGFTVNNRPYNYFTERNAFRLPNFIQWDINLTLKSKKRRRWQGEWVFGVTNLLNRHNPLTVFRNQRYSGIRNNNKFTNMYLSGWLPYVTYKFKF